MPEKESWGGPAYSEPPFVAGLRAAGVEVDEEVYVYGDKVRPTALLSRVRRVLETAWRLRRRVKAKHYDIIHLNTSFDEKSVLRDSITMAFVRSSRARIYLKMHGSSASFLSNKQWFWRYWKRHVFTKADALGVLSDEERENFLRAGCPSQKLFPTKYVVRSEVIRTDPDFRSRYGLAPTTPVLLFSARFIPAKGLLDVIRACSQLQNSGQEFALFCLGDGPVRDEAEQAVKDLRLSGRVHFFGYIPEHETTAFHASSTIFVFPTYHDEGFPLVLLKSLAAGLPIVTTRVRAAVDYLREPENCLWVEPRNPSQLAEKIELLLTNEDLRAAMSRHNHRLVEQFTASKVAQEYIEVCQTLVARK
jgi:glycosyltransferase involved in cell wall biosynthesis